MESILVQDRYGTAAAAAAATTACRRHLMKY